MDAAKAKRIQGSIDSSRSALATVSQDEGQTAQMRAAARALTGVMEACESTSPDAADQTLVKEAKARLDAALEDLPGGLASLTHAMRAAGSTPMRVGPNGAKVEPL